MIEPFLYIPDIKYNREELKEVLESKCKWFDFEKGSDAPLINKKDVPYSIRKFFNFTDPFVTSGFVKISPNYELEPHEDEYILEPIFNIPRILNELPKYYIDWLKIISARDWGIAFPISGDFTNIKTRMYRKDSGHYINSFSLDIAPTLFRTRGEYIHGVSNMTAEPRILFQLSFKGNYIYEAFKNKIYPSRSA